MIDVDTPFSPYAASAMRYRAAGWEGVLPLPLGAKYPPPTGFTGRRWFGSYPSAADVQTWIEFGLADGEPVGNVALRLPPEIIGLDVDAHSDKPGARTLAELESTLGPLPATWTTTSRDDGASGIRLFRLPAGVREGEPGRRWKDEAGPGIDVIRHGHRYAVVAPSVVEGREYGWLAPLVGKLDEIPRGDTLGELPAAWLEHLAPSGVNGAGVSAPLGAGELDEHGARKWLERCRLDAVPDGGQSACKVILAALEGARRILAARGAAGSRHEAALGASRTIAAYGGEGHDGAWWALGALERAFEESTRGEGREHEWRSMLVGAVALAKRDHPEPERTCTCDTFILTPDFSPPPGVGSPGGDAEEYSQAVDIVDPVEAMLAEMLTVEQLRAMPHPEPLVSGVLDLDSLAWMIGKPGSYKSFVALDLAAHISVGRAWLGHAVRQGTIVYLVAEGASGFKLRVDAWERVYGPMGEGAARFLPRPVQASAPEWNVLIEACRRLGPVLVVIDTQARVTVGLDESGNTEMGMFIEQCERLRRATRACVLVIHHIGRSGQDARGASAIDGAQGTEIKVKRLDDLRVAIVQDKQKDMAQQDDLEVELIVSDGGTDPATGRDLSSLVVRGPDPFGAARGKAKSWVEQLAAMRAVSQAEIVGIMAEVYIEAGGTKADVRASVKEARGAAGLGDMHRRTFDDAWDKLVGRGLLIKVQGTARYVLDSDRPLGVIEDQSD